MAGGIYASTALPHERAFGACLYGTNRASGDYIKAAAFILGSEVSRRRVESNTPE